MKFFLSLLIISMRICILSTSRICLVVLERGWMHIFLTTLEENLVENVFIRFTHNQEVMKAIEYMNDKIVSGKLQIT